MPGPQFPCDATVTKTATDELTITQRGLMASSRPTNVGFLIRAVLVLGSSVAGFACEHDAPSARGDEGVRESPARGDEGMREPLQTLAQVMVEKPILNVDVMRMSCKCGGEIAYKEMGYADAEECREETDRLEATLREAVPCIYQKLDGHKPAAPKNIDGIVRCMHNKVEKTSECFDPIRGEDGQSCTVEVVQSVTKCQRRLRELSGTDCIAASDQGDAFKTWLEGVDGVDECLLPAQQLLSD